MSNQNQNQNPDAATGDRVTGLDQAIVDHVCSIAEACGALRSFEAGLQYMLREGFSVTTVVFLQNAQRPRASGFCSDAANEFLESAMGYEPDTWAAGYGPFDAWSVGVRGQG